MGSAFAGFRFPPEVIVLAVRWYLRFGLSYRDLEELLAERGIDVDHVTIHRWVRRFTPLLADAARFARHRVGDRWHVDETYVKVSGRWVYLYRAVDQFGQVIDVYASARRDSEAARRFLRQARTSTGVTPSEVITDRAPTYPPGPRPAVAGGVAPHRAIRQQPDRGRPRPAETTAACDARDQDHDRASGSRQRARVRAEPAPRTLRDRGRRTRPTPTRCRIRRLGKGHLTAARTVRPPGTSSDRATQQTPLACWKNRRVAALSRRVDANTSMTCPNWSTARYRYTHRPATRTQVSSTCQRSPTRYRPNRAASTNSGAKRRTHRWIVTWSTSMPRSASNSSTSR